MSYQMFQQKCKECGETWNAAFGIVGMTQVAAPPERCPHCTSPQIEFLTYGWKGCEFTLPVTVSTFSDPPQWVNNATVS